MTSIKRVWIRYLLPFFGDFTNSLLLVIFILYGVQKNLTPGQIGWIGTSYGISYLISSPLVGKFGDKLSRKSSLFIATIGQSTLAFLTLLFVAADFSGLLVLLLIIISQILRAFCYSFFWPSIEAYLSEEGGKSIRNHQINIKRFCISWSLGSAIGSNIGGVLTDYSILGGIGLALGLYLISIILVYFTIQKFPNSSNDSKSSSRLTVEDPNSELSSFTIEHHDIKRIKSISFLLLLGILVYSVVSNGVISYFPNYAKLPQSLNFSGTLIGQIVFFYGLGRFIAFLFSDKLPTTTQFLIVSMFLLSICVLIFIFISHSIFFFLLMLILGLISGRIYFISLEMTLQLEIEGKGARAGLFEGIIGLGFGLTPLLSGLLAEINLTLPFLIIGIVMLLLSFMSLVLEMKFKSRNTL